MTKTNFFKNKQIKIIIIATLIILIMSNLSSWIIYFYMWRVMDNEMGKRLIATGKTILLKIEPEIFISNDEIKKIEFQLIKNYLNKIRSDSEIENIYIVDSDNKTILDAREEYIKNILHSYIENDKSELEGVLKGNTVHSKIYSLKGQYFKNAYLPIINKNKEIKYILCLEASAESLKFVKNLIIVLFLSGVLSIVLALIFAFYLNQTMQAFMKLEETLYHQEKFALMGQLSACVAHEIRNPLGIIKGSGEILKKRYQEEEIVEYINEEIERINRLINEFLSISKDIILNYQKIDINLIISKIIQGFNEKKIKINLNLDNDLPKINGDPEKLNQAFFNIILNAIQSLKEKTDGQISITTSYKKKNIKIVFEDNGIGIQKENLEKIFIPFFTTRDTGIGIGLFIVQKIIKAHEGNIEVESRVGEGSRFIVNLPIIHQP